MNLAQLAEWFQHSPDFAPNFTAWKRLPAREASSVPFPEGIDGRLRQALAQRGIASLYSHQARAAALVATGKHVVVVTPTASGKTLCYNLPVLSRVLAEPATRALYLFPTKALAQDQLDELHGLISAVGADIKTFTYDGDTPPSARRAVREAGHIVVTNPDMLHTGILPHHTKWMRLFESLRFVVVDELHQYRGVFGSHVANVLRRLRRICRFYGSDPVFICCSATIANPVELASRLTGVEVEIIADNGAPSGERLIGLYNPPVVNKELSIRATATSATLELASHLLESGVQVIAFARSRLSTEVLLMGLREAYARRHRGGESVRGYRGGYLPSERREIEKGLRSGEVRGVVATNALELGIDIGGMDAAVLCGYPGTIASTWQQWGRAGRRSDLSLGILVASSNPLDQYLVNHPDYLFGAPTESGLINPDNLLILLAHLKCAAFELPFTEEETFGVPTTQGILAYLEEQGVLHRAGGRWFWASEAFPAEEISLRSASSENFVVIEETPKPRVVGEVDRASAPMLLHEEAIYIHEGQQYQVERLDYEEKKAYVRRVEVDYYTDANLAVDLKVLEVLREAEGPSCSRYLGEVAVSYQATMFKKLRLETHENVGSGPIHLPQEDLHTSSYWLALSLELSGRLARDDLQSALLGLSHLLASVAPLFLMCDPRDIRAVCQVRSPFTERATVYLYDSYPGGIGLSERLFEVHREALAAALEVLTRCSCKAGCPACIGPTFEVGPAAKVNATYLLHKMLEHEPAFR